MLTFFTFRETLISPVVADRIAIGDRYDDYKKYAVYPAAGTKIGTGTSIARPLPLFRQSTLAAHSSGLSTGLKIRATTLHEKAVTRNALLLTSLVFSS